MHLLQRYEAPSRMLTAKYKVRQQLVDSVQLTHKWEFSHGNLPAWLGEPKPVKAGSWKGQKQG